MSWILQAPEAQIHLWPWSVEIPQQTQNLTEGRVSLPFHGSPVISLAVGAELRFPTRLERFTPLGPPYPYSIPTYQVYETPHGVLAGPTNSLRLRTSQGSWGILFTCEGAAERSRSSSGTPQQVDSELARHILAWSQLFDDLLEKARQRRGQSSELNWDQVLDQLNEIKEPSEPRMALIVRIAQRMRGKLPDTVSRARRILLRERDFVPLDRVQETDRTCLRWYVRQPGRTSPEKAGPQQRLLAVVRRESFDTLENRILKDFIMRCRREAARYLESEVADSPQMRSSKRAHEVRSYKSVCMTCLGDPLFEDVALPTPGIQPNYVLQHDPRYREVWQWYKQLLKRQEEEDEIWDWQPRTWADVMRLLVGAALELGRRSPRERRNILNGVIFEALVSSRIQLVTEQVLGSRIVPGSEPGPFLMTRMVDGYPAVRAVMELVHPSQAQAHPVAQLLGRTGGHLYLVLHPLGRASGWTRVLILWSVNGAGVTHALGLDEMARSACGALQNHHIILSQRQVGFPDLKGLIVVSRLEGTEATFHPGNEQRLPVLEASADPRGWEEAVLKLAGGLETIFGEML